MEMYSVEFYRITKKQKKIQQQNVTSVRGEPSACDCHALHATVRANSPFAGGLRPLDPYIAMLY